MTAGSARRTSWCVSGQHRILSSSGSIIVALGSLPLYPGVIHFQGASNQRAGSHSIPASPATPRTFTSRASSGKAEGCLLGSKGRRLLGRDRQRELLSVAEYGQV